MIVVDSGFIGNFKLGDNIHHNLKVLNCFYKLNDKILNKPKIVWISSIIEAILHDFYFKTRLFTREGIKNLSEDVINFFRNKRADKFHHYINLAKEKLLFGDNDIYNKLDILRKLRNRIHIQNICNDLEIDERNAFTDERRTQAEETLTYILSHMATQHNRGHNYVSKFELPWNTSV